MTGYILLTTFCSVVTFILGHRRGWRYGFDRGWTGGQAAVVLRNAQVAAKRSRVSG
jgi:hypothetical protein